MGDLPHPGAGLHLQLVEMMNNQALVDLRGRRQSIATPTERGSLMLQLLVGDAVQVFQRIQGGLHGDLLTPGVARVEPFAFRDDTDGFLLEVAPSARTGGFERCG